jgi:taurine dioxygenase
MRVAKLEPKIGAEITDVDVRTLTDDEWATLYRTWLESNVLVVRDQKLTMEEYLAYSRRFGRLKPHRVRKTRHPQHQEITLLGVNAVSKDGNMNAPIYTRGANWHTDSPWDTEVCKATQLYGIEIPSYGGDTLFANLYAAYDALPEALKARIDGLQAEFAYGGRTRQGIELLEPEDQVRPPAVHPVVHRHSETGRKSLYVNPVHILRIAGLPQAESDALIEELFTYMIQPGAEYRHKWRVGDIVIWDNRCSIHAATGGYPLKEKRIHWRVTIMEPEVRADRGQGRAA